MWQRQNGKLDVEPFSRGGMANITEEPFGSLDSDTP